MRFRNYQKWITHLTLINLHPNEYSQEFYYYPFAVKLDGCVGRCNTLNYLSNQGCVPRLDLNLSVLNMITEINESKTLTKHLLCKYKCRFHGRKCNSDQWWNENNCWYECKKGHKCEKDNVWNLATCSCENEKYLASIMDDSRIICDEVIESLDENAKTKSYGGTRSIPTNFNEKKRICKT